MKILIADDEINIRESLKRLFELEGMEAEAAADGRAAQELLEKGSYDLALVDLKMPRLSGQELLEWIRDEGIPMPVIIISAHGEIPDAVQALKAGARDFVEKPFDTQSLIEKVRQNAQEATSLRRDEAVSRTAVKETGLVGESAEIRKIRAFIDRLATTTTTVLITGESGTGKEVVAREIHQKSNRADAPFVAVNIAGLPENLIESELFGFEKGAFTSAVSRKLGLFELAGGGTLFLDEIGEMPSQLQVKLLRVLQERRIRRLGGTRDIPVDARIISATNRDLEKGVQDGSFREDLFYRLNVVRIEVPPLRERIEDLSLLTEALLERIRERAGGRRLSLTKEALDKLSRYPFPGNIRELENILERAAIYSDGNEIEARTIDIREMGPTTRATVGINPEGSIKEAERELIKVTLGRLNGNRTHSARALGISRRALLYKIKDYGL